MDRRSQEIRIPRILFAAPGSGSGKTMITCGFLEVMKRRKIGTVSYKCGPDYIDPMFHQYVLGIPSYNLDSYFLSQGQVRTLLADKMQKASGDSHCVSECCHQNKQEQTSIANIAVIEGVMGYYDGLAGISTEASTYEIASITDTPVILIVDAKKCSLSAAALMKGFCEFRSDSHIAGVILNRTSSMMGERLRPEIERMGLQYFGSVPDCSDLQFESRHLGLTLPDEQEKLREKLEKAADQLEKSLDVDAILKLAADHAAFYTADSDHPLKLVKKKRIAVAKDEAFCFYYQDNLDYLQSLGFDLVWFSPLHDTKLPDDIHAILLGGGYPECYAKQLSENHAMLRAVKKASGDGIRILAECGGFLYLHHVMEGIDGKEYPMAGILDADAYRTDRLNRFGYIAIEKDDVEQIRAHEFHYWESTAPGTDLYARKPLFSKGWECMILTESLMAGFPHLYYRSGEQMIQNFLLGGKLP